MGLHYKLRALLWLYHLKNATPYEKMPPAEARKAQVKSLGQLDRFISFPNESIFSSEDQQIAAENGEIKIRIYTPRKAEKLPVCLFFHGGGFVIGDVNTHDVTCRRLAKQADCIVISVDYRLSPEFPFPIPSEDCYTATLWAYQNAATFGGDSAKMAVCGDSAGANLATVVAMMLRDRNAACKLKYQALIYPTVDATLSEPSINTLAKGYLLTKSLMEWFMNHYIALDADRKNPYISPLFAKDLTGLPPALVATAEFDPLKDEGKKYAQLLEKAGIPTVFKEYKGVIHAFLSMPKLLETTRELERQIASELKKAFQA
ncbi:MAG: alpha/beta hydrolase [Cytophagales bacterium]|nr:MAG: alpha/beta hydrolase [Cytophagales bacterium]